MAKLLSLFASSRSSTRDDFEALLRPHIEVLWGTAYRYTGNRADAEDLLQELFTRLYPGRHKLDSLENLRPWLLRSLFNLFVDNRRRWSRNVLSKADSAGDEEAVSLVECERPGPEDEAVARSSQKEVFTALASLPPDQRAVIVMHDMEGHTLPELEEILDVPLGTLKSRLFRARRRMRELLGGNLLAQTDVITIMEGPHEHAL